MARFNEVQNTTPPAQPRTLPQGFGSRAMSIEHTAETQGDSSGLDTTATSVIVRNVCTPAYPLMQRYLRTTRNLMDLPLSEVSSHPGMTSARVMYSPPEGVPKELAPAQTAIERLWREGDKTRDGKTSGR